MHADSSGYTYGPVYRPSLLTAVRGVLYVARGTRRSLAHDGLYALANMPAPPLVRGLDRLPETGPIVIAANHYERPGLWMGWPAILLSCVAAARTGRDIRWVAIREWEGYRPFGIPVPSEATRAVFQRAFEVYGIVGMPPPDAPAGERADALRRALRLVRADAVLGIMPEGTVGKTPVLLPAREGSGAFLAMLAGQGARLVPCGIYEEEGRLVIAFGDPLALPRREGRRDEEDAAVRQTVMAAIRDLLPPALRGVSGWE